MRPAAPPPDLHVRLTPGTRVLDGGSLLIGGAPVRMLRLAPAAVDLVSAWRGAGSRVGEAAAPRALAGRLLDAGLLVPDSGSADGGDLSELAVVVPTYGRATQLERCLDAIRATATGVELIVVDDGSPDPRVIADLAARSGATVIRLPVRGGPAVARNAGARATERPLLVFVDSDVVVQAGALARLAGAFVDPATGAVAPRVHALEAGVSAVARYESAHSSLDMGQRAGRVGPGSPLSYVPSTTLAVRREAFGAGFDPELHVGEDVDLIWRLCAAGWNVWYDPGAGVRHEHRVALGGFLRRRFDYAASIGPLARRHPGALPALWADSALGCVLLGVSGWPGVAAIASLGVTGRRARQLRERSSRPVRHSAALTVESTVRAGSSLARAIRRVWWPLLMPLASRSALARRMLGLSLLLGAVEAHSSDPSQIALGLTDDVVASAGTWWSSLRTGTLEPLLPTWAGARRSRSG